MNNYKKLVEAAAEKYAKSLITDGVDEHYAKGMKNEYKARLQSLETVELIEQIAREAYAEKISYKGLHFSQYWAKFMGGEDGK